MTHNPPTVPPPDQQPSRARTEQVPQAVFDLLEPSTCLGGTRSSHRWAQAPGNWDRLNTRAIFAAANPWGIPDLPCAEWVPDHLVAYNSRREIDKAQPGTAVHFYLDDYRFETVWTKPERGLARIGRIGAALSPDFSLWPDMPLVMQLWQVYRSRWCGAWMLHHGIRIVPTVSWSTAASYDFAFAGLPVGGIVAVSAVGVLRDRQARRLFTAGYEAMIATVRPPACAGLRDAARWPARGSGTGVSDTLANRSAGTLMGGRGSTGTRDRYVGAVRYRVRTNPDGSGSVTAYQDYTLYGPVKATREVGSLVWTGSGKVHDIEVRPDRQRKGIGTHLWQQAQQATSGQLSHSPDRTDAGEAFARSVGGTTPPRSDWRPPPGSGSGSA
jgi:Vilmaviridae nuclease